MDIITIIKKTKTEKKCVFCEKKIPIGSSNIDVKQIERIAGRTGRRSLFFSTKSFCGEGCLRKADLEVSSRTFEVKLERAKEIGSRVEKERENKRAKFYEERFIKKGW